MGTTRRMRYVRREILGVCALAPATWGGVTGGKYRVLTRCRQNYGIGAARKY